MLVEVAMPVPVRTAFTYAVPERLRAGALRGVRVRAPFGRRRLIGVILGPAPEPPPGTEIREIEAVLDASPVIAEKVLELVLWIADYYQAPVGEAVRLALPPREGGPGDEPAWQAGDQVGGEGSPGGGPDEGTTRRVGPGRSEGIRFVRLAPGQEAAALALDRRAARLRGILDALAANSGGDGWVDGGELRRMTGATAAQLEKLRERGWIELAVANRPPADPGSAPGPVEARRSARRSGWRRRACWLRSTRGSRRCPCFAG
jgi:primosomal protein N'